MKIFAKPTTTSGLVIWLCLIIAIVIFGPFVTAWALNHIFHLNIEYSFDTWVAIVILGAFLRNRNE